MKPRSLFVFLAIVAILSVVLSAGTTRHLAGWSCASSGHVRARRGVTRVS